MKEDRKKQRNRSRPEVRGKTEEEVASVGEWWRRRRRGGEEEGGGGVWMRQQKRLGEGSLVGCGGE